jgi:hypothetical protein
MSKQPQLWYQLNRHSKMASVLISQILRERQNQFKIAHKKYRKAA